jgi:hypothetical protein
MILFRLMGEAKFRIDRKILILSSLSEGFWNEIKKPL